MLIPPSIPGSGAGGRLPDDGRGPGRSRPWRNCRSRPASWPARRTRNRACAASFRPSAPTVPSSSSTSTAPRRMSLGVPLNDVFQDAADLPGIVLRQPVQQVQPELPGADAGRCRLPPRGAGYRQSLRREQGRRDGAARRHGQSPADPRLRTGHPLQSLSGGGGVRRAPHPASAPARRSA